jgi:membrane-associated phospholipid phosphatase
VALVAAIYAWRGWRALGAVLLPAVVLLALATVYCQFHYAVDALSGAALAGLLLLLLPREGYRAAAATGDGAHPSRTIR